MRDGLVPGQLRKPHIDKRSVVTLLSIFGAHSIALPLSPAFPAHELQYILDQSQASMLLSSKKFEGKANDVLGLELENKPKYVGLEKRMGGGESGEVKLEGDSEKEGGMMLYTSGTTNRPVRPAQNMPLQNAN